MAYIVIFLLLTIQYRTELGKEVLFVMLKVDQGDVHTRIMKRHGGNEKAMEMLKVTSLISSLLLLSILVGITK